MNKKIILFTEFFPYKGGEQFLETEIKFYNGYNITIFPQHSSQDVRMISNDVKINTMLCSIENITKIKKFFYVIKSLFSSFLFKEFFQENLFKKDKIKSFCASMIKYYKYYDILDKYFLNEGKTSDIIIYTYWNTEVTYALQALKNRYNYKLISRIHRYDIYKEIRKYHYMPLKHQFTESIDKIFTITESANEYLIKTYGFKKSILELSRLGVEDHNIKNKGCDENKFHIVSCSFLSEVKQVEKIIQALEICGKNKPNIKYIWSHIGDGPLYEKLSVMAVDMLSNSDNIRYNFLGTLNNNEVYEFYRNNNIDAFVNVSKSEGVPVSIMEAMSCFIPVIAPDIGGIKDMLIDGFNGKMLPEFFSVDDLVNILQHNQFFKDETIRENSYEMYNLKYSATKNYEYFLRQINRV